MDGTGRNRPEIQGEQMTREEIIRIVEEEEVEFIRLQFTDLFGIFKNIAITSSQLERALDGRCMFDGSSIEGFVRVEESDMYLHPDLDTFVLYPWHKHRGGIARIICDVFKPDGAPFEGDPRYILKRSLAEALYLQRRPGMRILPLQQRRIRPSDDADLRYSRILRPRTCRRRRERSPRYLPQPRRDGL